jgi:hypothetical protein
MNFPEFLRGWYVAFAVLCLAFFTAGCDRTDELARPRVQAKSRSIMTSTGVSPKAIIQESVRTYQSLTSYEDAAYVRLSYEIDGRPTIDRAPLSIAWDRSGRIGLQVYSVTAGPQGDRWRLRLADEAFASQIISRKVPSTTNFEWLLNDAIVADRLAAGLAGFPPQLDLLLSEQPLAGLVDDASAMAFEAQVMIDGHACYVLAISRGELRYRLWIDQATMLLRRIQIPNENLAPQLLTDSRIKSLELTIELENVRSNSSIDWNRFAIEPTTDAVFVNHFVLPPNLVDTRGIGLQVPAFTLQDPRGKPIYESADPRRNATVLIWLADHPACQSAAAQLAETEKKLADAGISAGEVEFISVWAEPHPPRGTNFENLKSTWHLPGKIALDRDALGRDLFNVQEAPTLIVLDHSNRLQLREIRANPVLEHVLPQMLADLARGVDLAAEAVAQNQLHSQRFAAELSMASAIDGNKSPLPSVYEPTMCTLTEVARHALDSQAISAASDSHGFLWILSEKGVLQSLDPGGAVASSLQTSLSPPLSLRPTQEMIVSPDGDYFALADATSSQLQVFSATTERATTLELGTSSRPIDTLWLRLAGSKTPRLAVITSDQRTVLLDPTNKEQLSGRCPDAPQSLVAFAASSSAVGGLVVLKNGVLEPLELPRDSALVERGVPSDSIDEELPNRIPQRIGFLPAPGRWQACSESDGSYVLARGWLAADEPALFLLDANLKQLWHYRMPLAPPTSQQLSCAGRDPTSGLPVWCVVDGNQTVHLLRADGIGSDHLRLAQEIRGISLVASGNQLLLHVVHANESVTYELRWNR